MQQGACNLVKFRNRNRNKILRENTFHFTKCHSTTMGKRNGNASRPLQAILAIKNAFVVHARTTHTCMWWH